MSGALAPSRWVIVSLLLVWLAAPYWPASVDDVYIPIAYAWEWIDSGELRWTSGERVEGYSNFSWVVLLRAAIELGFDGAVAAKLMALASSVALLGLASRTLPRTREGTLVLLSLVAWAPLARWSVDGMETSFYALLLTAGWGAVCAGSWSLGMWALMVAAMTRPEGVAYLVVAVLVGVAWRNCRRADLVIGSAALGAFGLYHVGRVLWFGELLPTPILVKVSPVPVTLYGLKQAAGELSTAAGVLVAAVLAVRARGTSTLALVPLAVQTLVLARASGDWMTGARLLLPGVLASAVVWCRLGYSRRTSPVALLAGLAFVLATAPFIPTGYGTARWERRASPSFTQPLARYSQGLDTPLAEDVVWAVEQVPAGDTIFVPDVGMLGNVPLLSVKDMRGLTQRLVAEAIAEGTVAEEAGIRGYLTGPDRPSFTRVAAWNGDRPAELPAWMAEVYVLREEFGYFGGTIRWYSLHDRRPDVGTIVKRWETLHERFPSQPLVAWRYALSLAGAGRWQDALAVANQAASRWPDVAYFADVPTSLSFIGGGRPLNWAAGRGFGLYWNTSVHSRPLKVEELSTSRLLLDVDNPGTEGVAAEVSVISECGATVRSERIFSRLELALTAPECAQSGVVHVEVRFTNDTAEPQDRNLYAALSGG